MTYSVKFNGVELGEIIDVLQDFTPSIGVDWSPELLGTSGTRKGSEFAYTTYKSKAIPMPFTMTDDLEEKYDKLMGILNVSEPKPLVFESIPDRVFYAIPSGDLDFSEEGPLGEGTITWIIPDGVAHATVEKSFQAETNDNGELEVTVVNNGTEAVPVSYEIVHNNHDNGYVGIVSEYGAIQIGKIDEVDGETYKQNEVLATFEDLLDQQDDHGTNYMNPAHNMAGTLGASVEEGETYLVLTSEGSAPQAGKWNGGMRTLTLPADSEGHVGAKNFYSYFRHWFESDKEGQTGVQGIVFLDADNSVICGYKIYKTDVVGNTAFVEFLVNGNVVRKEHFTSIYYDTLNPYDKERGHNCVRKEGDKITMYYGGIYQVVTAPELADVECKKVQISISQYDARGLSDKYVKRNCFRAFTFEKVNVEKWRDVPNRYVAGDVIFVDGAATKIYRNGMNITGDEITGSTYFHAPPGNTKVQFFVSDFCDPKPTITARIREAYL
ncbi:distal tail protein Dit [uncultured Merdimonas sp.]|uniref:distal tail protein Dit n=1 Tax=uncultured Merdimonas sp. TaxID=2023269 RepID=UPI00320B5B2B